MRNSRQAKIRNKTSASQMTPVIYLVGLSIIVVVMCAPWISLTVLAQKGKAQQNIPAPPTSQPAAGTGTLLMGPEGAPTQQSNPVKGPPPVAHAAPPDSGAPVSKSNLAAGPISPAAGLVINATFDSSITSNANSAAIQAMINQAVAIYQAQFSDPITVSILFRYSTTQPNGNPMGAGALAQSNYVIYTGFSWATYINALTADAKTANDATANASLPASPLSTNIIPTSANGRSIGLNTPAAMFANSSVGTGGPYDGIVTLNSAQPFQFTRPPGANYDALRSTEHEIDEVLGLGSFLPSGGNLRPQDLFSWSSAGTRNLTSSGTRYFSINSGSTNIVGFNQVSGGDFGDWVSPSCPQSNPYVQNAFSCTGQFSDVTSNSPEAINLDVIGYDSVAANNSGPANDNFANGQVITGQSGTVNGTNVNATKEAGEPDHAGDTGGKSVWYQWQAPSSGSVTIDTLGSNFDTTLAVYTGSSVSGLTLIASNDDDNGLTSRVVFNAVNGTLYRIAVDGFSGASGNITLNWNLTTTTSLRIDTVSPRAGRTSGGQSITLTGNFTGLSTVTMGGVNAAFTGNASTITVTTPAHSAGAVQIDLTPTSGSVYSKANAFAYLQTVFTDDTIFAMVTMAKAQHIIELRQAVDAMRAVAGLGAAPWADPTLSPNSAIIKAVHILELRTYLEDAASRLGYATSSYTDPSLTSGFTIKRVYIEELRQRIRTIAG
jgi:hypothetical protein